MDYEKQQSLLLETHQLIKKNGLRKTVLLLDRYYIKLQSTNIMMAPSNSYRMMRRLMYASQTLLQRYIKDDLWSKGTVEQILERINIYLATSYIAMCQMLSANDEVMNSPTDSPCKQAISKSRLKHRLWKQLASYGRLIPVKALQSRRDIATIEFNFNEYWANMLNQLLVWSQLFKATNDYHLSAKILMKFKSLIPVFKDTKSAAILKVIVQYYCNLGQFQFKLCEFAQSVDTYNTAIYFQQKLINVILDNQNAPNIMELSDVLPVKPLFQQIVAILLIQTYSYEYLSQYSHLRECVQVGLWILQEILREDQQSQILIQLQARQQDTHNKYLQQIADEVEIRRIIVMLLGEEEDITEINKSIDKDLMSEVNSMYYNKYNMQKHNQTAFIAQIQVQSNPPSHFVSPRLQTKTDQQQSKYFQSFTTFDHDLEFSKKIVLTTESDSKTIKHSRRLMKSNRHQPPHTTREEFQHSNIHSTQFSSYCHTQESNYPQLDNELASLIVKTLQCESSEQFFDLNDIKRNELDKQHEDELRGKETKRGKAFLKFKKQYSSSMLIKPKPVNDSIKKLQYQIGLQYTLSQGCCEMEEQMKTIRNNQQVKPKLKGNSQFRQILLKHCQTLGLKRAKKKIMQRQEESALRQLQSKLIDSTITESMPKQNELDIMRKTIQTNMNTIKLIMDDNQSEQNMATRQLRNRDNSTTRLIESRRNNQQLTRNPSFQEQFGSLALSTMFSNAKNDSNKRMGIADLAIIKRKMNQFEQKKAVRYSQLYRVRKESDGL